MFVVVVVVACFILDMYVKDIESGICSKEGEPVVEKETAATALVDGRNLLGPVVGNYCMDLALKKAKDAGIGWVVAHGESWWSGEVLHPKPGKVKPIKVLHLFSDFRNAAFKTFLFILRVCFPTFTLKYKRVYCCCKEGE